MVPVFSAAEQAARGSRAPAGKNQPFRPVSAAVSDDLGAIGVGDQLN
jgi:hypothetical protein